MQYLQDLIVTNHILLLNLDEASKYPKYKGNIDLAEHVRE